MIDIPPVIKIMIFVENKLSKHSCQTLGISCTHDPQAQQRILGSSMMLMTVIFNS